MARRPISTLRVKGIFALPNSCERVGKELPVSERGPPLGAPPGHVRCERGLLALRLHGLRAALASISQAHTVPPPPAQLPPRPRTPERAAVMNTKYANWQCSMVRCMLPARAQQIIYRWFNLLQCSTKVMYPLMKRLRHTTGVQDCTV